MRTLLTEAVRRRISASLSRRPWTTRRASGSCPTIRPTVLICPSTSSRVLADSTNTGILRCSSLARTSWRMEPVPPTRSRLSPSLASTLAHAEVRLAVRDQVQRLLRHRRDKDGQLQPLLEEKPLLLRRDDRQVVRIQKPLQRHRHPLHLPLPHLRSFLSNS